MTKPSFLQSNNFPLAQVVLFLYSIITAVIAAVQITGFFSAGPLQTALPPNSAPALVYLVPALQNIFFAIGMATLGHQLSIQYHKLLWRVSFAVIGLQVAAATIQLTVQFNLVSVFFVALGLFGLASLIIGHDDAAAAIQK